MSQHLEGAGQGLGLKCGVQRSGLQDSVEVTSIIEPCWGRALEGVPQGKSMQWGGGPGLGSEEPQHLVARVKRTPFWILCFSGNHPFY